MASTIWRSPEVEEKFHRLSFELAGTQWDEVHYPRPPRDADDAGYTLSLRHELKLANHLAFLAHNICDARAISAVCLEEQDEGLLVRLASNESPKDATLTSLQAIVDSLSQYSQRVISRDVFLENVSRQVLTLSEKRIRQRERRGQKRGAKLGSGSEQLAARGGHWLGLAKNDRGDPAALVEQARLVSSAREWGALVGSSRGGAGSQRVCEEVEKLARYHVDNLCGDLEKLGRRARYRRLLRSISVVRCERYGARQPRGAQKVCHVHAEVQLIIWYERRDKNVDSLPPRAIGCSKSACYLCHLLIQKLGKYVVSNTHARFYQQWTVPNIALPARQNQLMMKSIDAMIADMESLLRRMRLKKHKNGAFVPESRPESMLSAPATLSQVTVAAQDCPQINVVIPSSSCSTLTMYEPNGQHPAIQQVKSTVSSLPPARIIESRTEELDLPQVAPVASSASTSSVGTLGGPSVEPPAVAQPTIQQGGPREPATQNAAVHKPAAQKPVIHQSPSITDSRDAVITGGGREIEEERQAPAASITPSKPPSKETLGGSGGEHPAAVRFQIPEIRVEPADSIKSGHEGRTPGPKESVNSVNSINSIVSCLHLERDDLPYEHHMGVGSPIFELQLGALSLLFDCLGVASGHLSVKRTADFPKELEYSEMEVDVDEIPEDRDLDFDCKSDSRSLTLRLTSFGGISVDIEVKWGEHEEP